MCVLIISGVKHIEVMCIYAIEEKNILCLKLILHFLLIIVITFPSDRIKIHHFLGNQYVVAYSRDFVPFL